MPICLARVLLRVRNGALAVPALLGDPQTEYRLLERRGGRSFQLGSAPLGQSFFGAAACFLGALAVDLLGALGNIGQHDDLVVLNLKETARYSQVALFTADPVHQLADGERCDERLMTVQNAEVALGPAGDDDVDILIKDHALGRDHLQVRGCHVGWSF
jgi:hypothetical protein